MPYSKKQFKGPGGISEMLAIAFPMVVSSACDTVMTFTDRLFLAKLSSAQMSAAMGGGLTCFLMMTFFMGLTGYSTALVAQYLGSGQKNKCALAAAQAIIVCLVAYPLILACRPAAHWLFDFAKLDPAQLAPQKLYFNIMLYAVIIGLLRNTLSCFFSGIGKTRIVMISALSATVLNVGANYVLIFGKFGFPALGIQGAAYGTILGGVLGLLILVFAFIAKTNRREFQVLHALRLNWPVMRKLLRFGSPAGFEFFLNLLAFTGMITAFHAHHLTTATAITIVFNWDMVSFVPLIGIQIGVTSLVGRYMGAGQPDIAHRATISALKLGWLYSGIILVIFVSFPEFLVGVFRPSGHEQTFLDAYDMAVIMLRLAALYVMCDSIMIVFTGALRGAGDTFWTMCASVIVHWLMLPTVILFLHVLGLSPVVTWFFLILVFMTFSLIFYLRFRGGKWRTMQVVETLPSADLIPDPFHEPADI